jgi:nucleotide-binding universal stress UspA family protein
VRVLAWIAEGSWEACVDAVRELDASAVTLLHVAPDDVVGASGGALAGLLGRHRRDDVEARLAAVAGEAAEALLESAAQRLGREDAERVATSGRAEVVVMEAASDADVLVLGRQARRPGPRSLGHPTRFVVDHAPCKVVIVWPEGAPDGPPPPPPPDHGPGHLPPPPPHEGPHGGPPPPPHEGPHGGPPPPPHEGPHGGPPPPPPPHDPPPPPR